MKRSVLFLPAVAVVLSLGIAGCGGSDGSDGSDGSTSDAPAISHDDFVTKANKICADATADLQAAGSDLTATSTKEEVVAFLKDSAIPNFQDQHDAIEDLGVPEGDEEKVDTLLGALQDGIDAVSDDPAAFIAPDADPFADANAAATDLGLTDCAA